MPSCESFFDSPIGTLLPNYASILKNHLIYLMRSLVRSGSNYESSKILHAKPSIRWSYLRRRPRVGERRNTSSTNQSLIPLPAILLVPVPRPSILVRTVQATCPRRLHAHDPPVRNNRFLQYSNCKPSHIVVILQRILQG